MRKCWILVALVASSLRVGSAGERDSHTTGLPTPAIHALNLENAVHDGYAARTDRVDGAGGYACGGCACGGCACGLGLLDWNVGERLKGLPFGPCGSLDVGGQYRMRYHNENNMRRAGLTGMDDEFMLYLTRVWLEARFHSFSTVRAEFMDAASFGEAISPRANEVNRHDLYQLYADLVWWDGQGKLTSRVGRQEMKYGSARLIMAPEWANRRRAHDGVRLTWDGPNWTSDAFWVRPIYRDPAHFYRFDSTNLDQELYGIYNTYKGLEHDKLDLYWLAYDFVNDAGTHRYDTLGTRYHGGRGPWVYEFEGGYQFGRNPDGTDHSAGFFTGGIGRKFDREWEPELWIFYDWASGADTVGNGFHTYVQRAHYYLGWMDLFGRRNLEDVNARLTLKPTDKLTLVAWYHYFMLANGNDVAYNLNMRPFAGMTAGQAGSQDLGHELDLVATWQVTDQLQLRVGYSHFWSGRFYDTSPVPYSGNANFAYSHMLFNF